MCVRERDREREREEREERENKKLYSAHNPNGIRLEYFQVEN